jgi:hypothetical protein
MPRAETANKNANNTRGINEYQAEVVNIIGSNTKALRIVWRGIQDPLRNWLIQIPEGLPSVLAGERHPRDPGRVHALRRRRSRYSPRAG